MSFISRKTLIIVVKTWIVELKHKINVIKKTHVWFFEHCTKMPISNAISLENRKLV